MYALFSFIVFSFRFWYGKLESRGVLVGFYLGYDGGELWVMFGGLNECLEEVMAWFEGLV